MELAIAEEQLAHGDEVVWVGCEAELPACDINFPFTRSRCSGCKRKKNAGLKMLSHPVTTATLKNLRPEQTRQIDQIPKQFASLAELKGFKFQGTDLGMGVVSTLVSKVREPHPDIKLHEKNIQRMLKASATVHCSVLNHLDEHGPVDRVYLFNGRFSLLRAAFRACQKAGVSCWIHERGRSAEYTEFYVDHMPHDIHYAVQRMQERWEAAEPVTRRELAESFYTGRRHGRADLWKSFTKEQIAGKLPEGWNHDAQNVVIFNSSEDEFASIGPQWDPPIYANQLTAFRSIVQSLESNRPDKLEIYLRIHPNLANASEPVVRDLLTLKRDWLHVIPPNATCSSYAMLDHCERAVTFGSTMGIEATYWRKPSILLGQCYYRELGATINPIDHEDFIRLLHQPVAPSPLEPALIYAHYLKTLGRKLPDFDSDQFSTGTFRGKPVRLAFPWNVAQSCVRAIRKKRIK
ncbi:capsular polysaccharide export protein, LipB/KpsS family [Rhodopirellula baltica]